MDVEEDNNENYSEESGVSIRKANRPKKNKYIQLNYVSIIYI